MPEGRVRIRGLQKQSRGKAAPVVNQYPQLSEIHCRKCNFEKIHKNDSLRYREDNHCGKDRLHDDGEQMLKQKTERRPEIGQSLIESCFSVYV
jgi:hypothetical protein